VWHFRDISAFKEIGRMKDEFISAVSHELRTPLTSIRGSLDLMAIGVMGELPSEAIPVVELAQRNCERLVRLINDVLDIEKIEAGRMDFNLEVMELEPLLLHSVETLRPYGARLGVAFRIERSAPGARARVDPDRLIQVMENLLSNAAKFSPSGETVQVALARRGRDLRVSVTNRGAGIAPELQSRLFEKFAQGDLPHPSQKGGTGLGLNIARAIVERLGGNIGVVSRPGVSTTFHFNLPEWTTFHFNLPEWRAGQDGESMP
jgi:signal transduction histidine kinase